MSTTSPITHRIGNDNKYRIKIENYEDHIPKDVYDNITDTNTKNIIYDILVNNCPPKCISKEIWKALGTDDKVAVFQSIDYLETQKKQTSILKRIYQRLDQPDIEPSINTLALICALVLGIPFGISQLFNEQQLLYMESILSNCPSDSFYVRSGLTWNYTKSSIPGNWSCTVYGSMVGLLIAAVYYALKPPKDYIRQWLRVKGKILLAAMVLTTASAIIGLMDLAAFVLNYIMVTDEDLCNFSINEYFIPGIFFLLGSIVFTIILMM